MAEIPPNSENLEPKVPEIQESENPPRNILTNYEETLNAMAEIEGEGWKKRQEITRSGYCLLDALDTLQKVTKQDPYWDFQVYGSGGYNRYFVRSDGSVEFSSRHAEEKDIKKAKALGFKIL